MNYTANDIVSLSPGAAFRQKIGMYLSADRQEAINLGLRELIVNVQDEYEVFKPKNPYLKIELNSKTKEITVSDNMRGIPVGIRNDGVNSLTAAFLIPHSGGKHEEGVYSSAVGINGEGNKVVCHTAKWLKVVVHRDGKIYSQSFESDENGAHPTTEVIEEKGDNSTGTTITYTPDPEVYGDIFIDIDKLRKMLKEISYFTIGLKIQLIVDGEEEIFLSEKGLIDGLDNSNSIGKPFSFFYETSDCKVELALQWVSKRGEIKGYANGLYMPDGGAFITGFKTSLTKTFNNLAKTSFSGDQIRNVLDGFVSVKVKVGQFSNQAKTALANPEARTATASAITNALKQFNSERNQEFAKVVEILKKVEKAEIAAEKARNAILNAQKEIESVAKKKVILADKLKDCKNHGEESILCITEGDSALGALVQGRPIDNVALIPIRGKIISALKNPTEDVLENEEVKAIFSALGCGFFDKFNLKKMRYGKVGVVADQDQDGNNIFVLVATLFYFLAPEILKEGRLYRIQSPLYILHYKKETLYAFSNSEKEALLKTHGKNCEVTRIKG